MPLASHKQLFRRFHEEVLLGGNLDAIDELVDPNVVSHNPIPGQKSGAVGLKEAMHEFRTAFPDMTSKMTLLIAEGDQLACRFEAEASHKGEFIGLRPTGLKFAYEEMVFVRFKNNLIVEHWAVADTIDMMIKMGAIEYKGGKYSVACWHPVKGHAIAQFCKEYKDHDHSCAALPRGAGRNRMVVQGL
jgi:predicted ester cyclase